MTYFPLNARSELVAPTNFSDGGVFDTTRIFQDASPASMSPARRPTRGSGVGATVDMLAPPPDDAHAARDANPSVTAADRQEAENCTASFMGRFLLWGPERVDQRGMSGRVTGRAPRRGGR